MMSPNGELVLVLNHNKEAAHLSYTIDLSRDAKKVTEITAARQLAAARQFKFDEDVPAETVRVFRIDY
jgi:hypothetical protein